MVPIRFDTRFYVALAPPHGKPEPDRTEVDEARWLDSRGRAGGARRRRPRALLPDRQAPRGADRAIPDADAVIAEGAARRVEAITPKVRGDRENFEVLLPGDPGFADA